MKKTREYFFGRGEDFANALGDGGENGEAFVRVAPYGDAPQFDKSGHEVVQRFDFPAARKLVAEFNARKAKLLSRLGFANYEVPFYNGHPDFAENGGEARDSQVYASAYDLEAREDGLYARIRRHPLLASLKNALGALQISPRWLCEVDIDGILKPFELISFGLVKKGNLPNADFINNNQKIHNKEQTEMNEEQLKQARALLSLAEDASVDEVLAAIASLTNRQGVAEKANEEAQEALKEKEKELADAANQLADMQGICKRKDDEITEAKKELDTANETLSEREKELARMILDEAIAAGKMTPAMRKAFEAAFALEFANTAETVKNLPAVADLGDDKEKEEIKKAEDVSNTERGAARKGFADLVNAMQKDNPGMAFSECVSAVFATADGKKLYEKGF